MPKEPPTAAQVVVASEHYNRIARLLEQQHAGDARARTCRTGSSTTRSTPSTSSPRFPAPIKADEVVMLGAHFDSWHAGTGATDNAAGSAVMMEAMRILKATGLRMRRTVRLGALDGRGAGPARLARRT